MTRNQERLIALAAVGAGGLAEALAAGWLLTATFGLDLGEAFAGGPMSAHILNYLLIAVVGGTLVFAGGALLRLGLNRLRELPSRWADFD